MNSKLEPPDSTATPSQYSVPWTVFDSWLGVLMLGWIAVLLIIIWPRESRAELAQGAGIIFLEMAFLLPVALIFAWRRISWRHLGFRKFEPKTLGLGCGLLIAAYMLILVHNIILLRLGLGTQGETILRLIEGNGV